LLPLLDVASVSPSHRKYVANCKEVMSLSLQLASVWLNGQQGDSTPVNAYLTDKPEVTLFARTKPRHTPFSFVHVEVPAKENAIDYNGSATFVLDQLGDLLSNVYLHMSTSALNYLPIRDENVVRACRLSDLPNEPVNSYLGGLSRLDVQAAWVDYMGYAMLDRATWGSQTGAPIEELTGDYLFLMNDIARRQDLNFASTLPDNNGGASNLGNNPQSLYVPLLFSWTKEWSESFPINAMHYSTPQIKVKLGPAPFRGDATGFQIPGYDPTVQAQYRQLNGQDVLPHDMFERYAEYREGALQPQVSISVQQQNSKDKLLGDYLPRLSLHIKADNTPDFVTGNYASNANVIKLKRRSTYQFDTTNLLSVKDLAVVDTNNNFAFVWDYTNTGSYVQFVSGTGDARTGNGEPTAASLRLYGSLDPSVGHATVTVTYVGMQAFTVATTMGSSSQADPADPAPATTTGTMGLNQAQTWGGAAAVDMASVKGSMQFRIDPQVQGQLQINDSWSFTVSRRTIPLNFTVSDQPWGNALPAEYLDAPPATGSVMFTYSGNLNSQGDSRVTLDNKTAGSIPGFQFPSWLSQLNNGNVLYYHTGPDTPAVLRPSLQGMVLGVFSDGLNFDYMQADPGQRVDAQSDATAGALVATDSTGLFDPLFPGKLGKPAVGTFPQGYDILPVYCYTVSDHPVYHEAVYVPVINGGTLQRFAGPSADIGGQLQKVSLVTNTTFLSDPERITFASANHQRLYTQMQRQTFRLTKGQTGPKRYKLNFTGPCQLLTFFFRPDAFDFKSEVGYNSENYWNWQLTDPNKDQDLFSSANVVLNNQSLYDPPRDPLFFKHLMPTQYRTSTPRQRCYTIPFSLQPDCESPSGSINLSLYDSVELVLDFSNGGKVQDSGTLYVFADVWNVWTIRNGQLGVVFVH
jgi:hypothetical protein